MGVHAKREFNCPVDATISLIGGKYKAVILWHLKGNTLRYSIGASRRRPTRCWLSSFASLSKTAL